MNTKDWAEELLSVYGTPGDKNTSDSMRLYDIKHLLALQIRLMLRIHEGAIADFDRQTMKGPR